MDTKKVLIFLIVNIVVFLLVLKSVFVSRADLWDYSKFLADFITIFVGINAFMIGLWAYKSATGLIKNSILSISFGMLIMGLSMLFGEVSIPTFVNEKGTGPLNFLISASTVQALHGTFMLIAMILWFYGTVIIIPLLGTKKPYFKFIVIFLYKFNLFP